MNQPRDREGWPSEETEGFAESSDPPVVHAGLEGVLRSAALLQKLVPDAVLVGGTAASYHAGHRHSYDHDHVLDDLATRFDLVLEALEREPEWVTNRVVAGKIVLGSLGGIEAGVRQMIRRHPLDVEEVPVGDGLSVRVPTESECLRIKAFLVVRRNQMRDYLDVAALSAHLGTSEAARILSRIDAYYADLRGSASEAADRVASQVARQLGDPRPADSRSIAQLPRYKGVQPPWDDWKAVRTQCAEVAARMLTIADGEG